MLVCSIHNCRDKVVYKTKRLCLTHKNYRYARENRERRTAYHRDYRAKCKRLVFEHYGALCNCCGESNYLFLSIDHINNDGSKDLAVGGYRLGGGPLYMKIIARDFPDTFQVLCMNCNFGKRMNKGVCPHDSSGVLLKT